MYVGDALLRSPSVHLLLSESRKSHAPEEDEYRLIPEQQVLDTPEPLRNLADLIAAQLEYHKKAYEILSELAPVVDGLQVEQEVKNSKHFLFAI